ncbi:MAG: MBL fold metallo-hydrolase [Oscillospiraceae bacterium]|nr:MBL fold metallo-hydrolase [Oscillospiraceae bacterium]
MKITFLGAANEVTGSCTLIEADDKNILVDCGMEQGPQIFAHQELPVNPAKIDCVLLTHAHIDHSGKLPLLYKNGFRGKIYATESTCNLCRVMLRDSAHIQMSESEWKNRKAKRAGLDPDPPLYDINDAEGAIAKLHPVEYDRLTQVLENVDIRFKDVAHLLGSACIEVWLTETGVEKKLVFSGDIGTANRPIITGRPAVIDIADYAVIESTYGDKNRVETPDNAAKLAEYIQKTLNRGGNVVIPSFAVGRTQEILYMIREIKTKEMVRGHGVFPVYVDSPLANEATGIFLQCNPKSFNEETNRLLSAGVNPLMFPGLRISESPDESRIINSDKTPKVIISASGMCEAGRVRHHLKHNLWKSESLILFVGYQTPGTLGRIILDGAKSVKLFGEEINVNAEIAKLEGMSSHADKQGLLDWLLAFDKKPGVVFVNHGDEAVCLNFRQCLETEYGYNSVAPYSGTCYDLITGKPIRETLGIREERPHERRRDPRAVSVFSKLIAAANKLLTVARSSEGRSNKDIAAFTSQIEKLSEKWGR